MTDRTSILGDCWIHINQIESYSTTIHYAFYSYFESEAKVGSFHVLALKNCHLCSEPRPFLS